MCSETKIGIDSLLFLGRIPVGKAQWQEDLTMIATIDQTGKDRKADSKVMQFSGVHVFWASIGDKVFIIFPCLPMCPLSHWE